MVDNTANLCMNCMTHGLRSDGVCSSCGADERALGTSPHHLRPRTLLNNKYLVGRVIGEGGFGITYVGWDAALSIKIAIKEYYPSGFVSRYSTDSMTVQSYSGDKGAFFAQGRDRFIKEAQRLARFFGLPGIVSVKDFFNENGTAYIIMEFLEGASMRSVLSNMGERMQEAHVLEIMKPLISSLGDMHKSGIIHRDIAPDNIMILPDGSVKLIDFGAAREVAAGAQSTVAVMKHGYTPEEQYDSDHTRQGPWTDVYALCATIYRAIEGVTPPDAISRLRSDTFRGFTVPVSANTSRVVMKGLALAPENRWHDVGEMWRELYTPAAGSYAAQPAAQHVYQQQGQVYHPIGQPAAPAKAKSNKMITAMIGGGAALILLVILIAVLSGNGDGPAIWSPSPETEMPSQTSDMEAMPEPVSTETPPLDTASPDASPAETPPADTSQTQPPPSEAPPEPAASPEMPPPQGDDIWKNAFIGILEGLNPDNYERATALPFGLYNDNNFALLFLLGFEDGRGLVRRVHAYIHSSGRFREFSIYGGEAAGLDYSDYVFIHPDKRSILTVQEGYRLDQSYYEQFYVLENDDMVNVISMGYDYYAAMVSAYHYGNQIPFSEYIQRRGNIESAQSLWPVYFRSVEDALSSVRNLSKSDHYYNVPSYGYAVFYYRFDFMFPDSYVRFLTEDDISHLTELADVQRAINEIYARRGLLFTTQAVREYFESKEWYNGRYESIPDSVFNQFERENIRLLVRRRSEL